VVQHVAAIDAEESDFADFIQNILRVEFRTVTFDDQTFVNLEIEPHTVVEKAFILAANAVGVIEIEHIHRKHATIIANGFPQEKIGAAIEDADFRNATLKRFFLLSMEQ
jgi:hypothetical protein